MSRRPNNNNRDGDDSSSFEEAQEDNEVIIDEDIPVDEPESAEDLEENMEEDEEELKQDNYYERGSQDDQEFDSLDESARLQAEQMMEERDRLQQGIQKRKNQRGFRNLLEDLDSDEVDINERYRQRLQDLNINEDQEMEDEDEGNLDFINHYEERGSLSKWIKEERTQRYIKQKFTKFLKNFKENQNLVYIKKIQQMVQNNSQSLEIDFTHLTMTNQPIALWVAREPQLIFPILNGTALYVASQFYQDLHNLVPEIQVKITNYVAIDSLRNLRQKDIGTLIQVEGVCTKRSIVFSQLKKVTYRCVKCGEAKGPIFFNQNEEVKLGACTFCQSKGPFYVDKSHTIYRNYQKITIQESPGKVQAGRVPRQKDVVLLGDNIDSCRPGDEVTITGIYTHRYDYALNVKHGFPIFSTVIEANNIKRMSEVDNINYIEEDKQIIMKWANKPKIADIIINSVAPSIHGHRDVKTGIALAMFGGVAKDIQGKHRLRGDINMLILGDPGTAKSQFLKSVEKTFHRSVYTTGKGASAVGLTAAVRKDPQTREWTLEGGALVLADRGICLIDEFDKMNDHDRTSIHEAMEQQSISISKAGIIANLQARCSVIAAANPIGGKYNSQLSFMENVELTDPILSRFDVLCVVKDEVDTDLDKKLAAFVINSHMKNHPTFVDSDEVQLNQLINVKDYEDEIASQEKMPQQVLRKYIMYARDNIQPKMTDIDREKISKFYQDLRAESIATGGMNIAVRHIESIIRMAEAHAKMHLRNVINNDDVDKSIAVMLRSFIQSQKHMVAMQIEKKFRHYLNKGQDSIEPLYNILDKKMKEKLMVMRNNMLQEDQYINEVKLMTNTFEEDARSYRFTAQNIQDFYQSKKFKNHFQIRGQVIVMPLDN